MCSYQKLVRNFLYPLDRWRTGDGAELHYLREFERTQFLPAEELRELASRRLMGLIQHAYDQCRFYRRQFEAVGLVPDDVSSLQDLAAVPILEKRHIQQHRDEMVAQNWPLDDLVLDRTGGSTGTPISFFFTRRLRCLRAAATWRHNRWAGWDIGDKVAIIWGAARDAPGDSLKKRLRNMLIDRTLFLNTANITESGLHRFHRALKRFRPRIMLAYAKSMVLFARYVKSQQSPAYQPHSIITSAEVLEPADRARRDGGFVATLCTLEPGRLHRPRFRVSAAWATETIRPAQRE